ncbi:acyltransferase [Pseudomonas sp. CCI3.2]|uniref:acyltransferase family protein n=1 Tax=unclassified Pseudomonas TaxID=196821 RepID=UPI002AC8B5A5|nr:MULTISPECIES: acyltransferase [unclassified Pseudomonas]MEB0078487.1 acyltransferase [Pseudomonas sp. MH10out]MEB0090107.1 acyltransferase [Pseudomonas sp. CCI4.2]MEB0104513.1 acyltransferase [Pseudomonas sp. CCI3.2]MEB0131730.1 acyltransferase [Pseudomonas sp. CCI2.4]MEB0158110.1 acyltransferase [Pseudomonas sp. AH2 (2023)]
MSPVSFLPAIVAVCVALATAGLLAKWIGVTPVRGRYASIDGLRGYLAFFVFLHHSCIWYFYAQSHSWDLPPSNLYTNFGQTSVFLFFMITGFLFFSKLLDAKTKPVDWGRLYVSRVLRLAPLYLLVMVLLFIVVFYLSNWTLREPLLPLLKGVVQWLSFSALGEPDLNGVANTSLIVAGVVWSLPYEWLFYLALPLLALGIGRQPVWRYVVIAVVLYAVMKLLHLRVLMVYPFAGGLAAALIIRVERFKEFATCKRASLLVLMCLVLVVTLNTGRSNMTVPLFLLIVAFCLIACGNNLFGVLTSKVSRTLGEMAYSIYLLHGLVLFSTMTFVIGIDSVKMLSPFVYWSLIVAITPVLITLCAATFKWVEQPAMHKTERVTAWLRSYRQPLAQSQPASDPGDIQRTERN